YLVDPLPGCAKDTGLFRPFVASRRTSCEIVLVTLLSVHSSWQFVSPTTSDTERTARRSIEPAPLVLPCGTSGCTVSQVVLLPLGRPRLIPIDGSRATSSSAKWNFERGENDSTDKEETARGRNETKSSSGQVVPAKQNLHASRSRTTPTPTPTSTRMSTARRDVLPRKRGERNTKQRGRKRELRRTKMEEGLEGGIWKTAALFPKADEKGRVGPEEGRGENGAFSVADKSVTSENAKHSPWVATKSSMVKSVEAIVVGEGDVCGVVQQQSQHVIPFLRDRVVKRITVDNEWNRTIHLDSLQNWINASASFGSGGYDSNDTYELQPVVGLVEDDELTNESFKTSARRKANLDFKCRCHSKSEEQSFNVTDEYNVAKQLHCYRELIVFQVSSLLSNKHAGIQLRGYLMLDLQATHYYYIPCIFVFPLI
ncbi:hypothetical protein ALC57_09514, partial [Trachymyrmex cornetzi]